MQEIIHFFLAKGENSKQVIKIVKNFLEKYELMRYDFFEIEGSSIFSANSEEFWENLSLGIEKNKEILTNYLSELKSEGFSKLEDISEIPQGYLSKVFHIIAHLVDGFFGIDSAFYNLIEDSHFLSEALKREIKENPEKIYLIKVKAYIKEPLYKFELLKSKKVFSKDKF
ncbi:MAG: hypothetical protein C0190_06635 [Thermodesulfobacterium geofontis]|uniref:Uncharacterized protein n=1 Tax=Thermodesulfobacterium geofontis TaxID=1295609 RepID=A0A2N7PM60_9BACT|nr:MAG: hypothetical protein C0190_06635 [Thermodesulfobacterium geofontis]